MHFFFEEITAALAIRRIDSLGELRANSSTNSMDASEFREQRAEFVQLQSIRAVR